MSKDDIKAIRKAADVLERERQNALAGALRGIIHRKERSDAES